MSFLIRGRTSSIAAPDALAVSQENTEMLGCQFRTGLNQALREYIGGQQNERPRRHVMAGFASSLDEFDSLYRELAK